MTYFFTIRSNLSSTLWSDPPTQAIMGSELERGAEDGEPGAVAQLLRSPDGSIEEKPTLSSRQFTFLCIGVGLGLFLSMIDTSIIATSLYSISVEFESFDGVNWVALAYTLAYLGCAVSFSRLSDVIGRRNAFMGAYIIFFVFSLACGCAQSLNQLISFRAAQGIGGSGLYSLSMIILPEVSGVKLQPRVGALVGFIVAFSGVLGPVLGGLLATYASWRWVFWINGPIGAISMVIFWLAWPKKECLPEIERRSWSQLDYLGTILTIAAAVLVVFAFQSAGDSWGRDWGQAIFIAPLVAGIICWAALVGWQYILMKKFEDRLAPAFPVSLFKNRIFTTGAFTTLLLGYPYLMLIYVVPLRIQVVDESSALTAGVMLLPLLGSVAIGSIVSAKINTKRDLTFETLLVGSLLMTLGCSLLAMPPHLVPRRNLLGFLSFAGLGFGLTVAVSTMISSLEAPPKDYAPAQGILAQFRILGGSLGIATSTAIMGNNSAKYLQGVLSPEQIAMLGKGGQDYNAVQTEAVCHAFTKGFQENMIAAAIISAVAMVCALGAYKRQRRNMSLRSQQRERD